MKVGIRKPSIKKSISARTTGKLKRQVKKAVNPMYGKKGMGMITNPKKAVYNKVYNKTTVSVSDLTKVKTKSTNVKTNKQIKTTDLDYIQDWIDKVEAYEQEENNISAASWKAYGIIMKTIAVIIAILFGLPGLFTGMFPLLIIAILATYGCWKLGSKWSKRAAEAKAKQSMNDDFDFE